MKQKDLIRSLEYRLVSKSITIDSHELWLTYSKRTDIKDYPENSIPDRKHPHSLQKYFQSKRLIPDCKLFLFFADPLSLIVFYSALEWNQLNTKQQDELILRDKKDRIKKADKKIVSILDELFDVSSS